MARALSVLILLALFSVARRLPAADEAAVNRFGLFEVELQAQGACANPYTDLTGEVTITPPEGRARSALLFWDGRDQWKLRVSPDLPGTWKWSVKSRDAGLDGKSGSFQCVAAQRKGSIRPMAGHPLHFERQDGTPFWFLGDTAWALFTDSPAEKLDRAAALAYLDARAGQGFNVVHSMLLSEAGWGNQGGQPFDDLAAEKLNPGYWQEADLRLAHANSRGIVCGLALAWGDKGRGEPYAWRKFRDAEARRRYARYIAARYSAFDTYFLLSGEWHAEIRSRQSDEETVRQEFIDLGNVLHQADPHRRMIGIHPMTSQGSVREFARAEWMAFGDYQQNYVDLHGRILQSRARNKPVVNAEYGYLLRDQSGDGVPDKDNSTSLAAMRHATWDIAMAGGYLVTGFGTTYFGGNRDPGPFDLAAAKNKPWEEQIGRVKSIFGELPWPQLAPHDELLACPTPRGAEGKEFGRTIPPPTAYWCLADPGKSYLVYFRGLKTPLTLTLPKDTPLPATQINPRTGERLALGRAIDRFEIRPPDDQDWVIVLAQSAN